MLESKIIVVGGAFGLPETLGLAAHKLYLRGGRAMAYKAVRVKKGRGGWGGPLVIKPQPGKDLIYCVTGGGIHPVAQRIADLTGGKVFDGFRSSAPEKQIACVVIDCGGTARIGVYPMKRLLTVDVKPSSPSGPLIQFIKEDIFVSGVRPEDITVVE